MHKYTTHKIGLPNWLKELISKGKYSYPQDEGTVTNLPVILENGRENELELGKEEGTRSFPNESGSYEYKKNIGKNLFAFDRKNKIIIIEGIND